jgi:hypothetical protein
MTSLTLERWHLAHDLAQKNGRTPDECVAWADVVIDKKYDARWIFVEQALDLPRNSGEDLHTDPDTRELGSSGARREAQAET